MKIELTIISLILCLTFTISTNIKTKQSVRIFYLEFR